MRYLLDTNIVIAAMKGLPPVREALGRVSAADVVISPVVLGELEFGVARSAHGEANARRLLELMTQLEVAPLDARVGRHYGCVRHELESRGRPIGANDLWIAAHCLALDATLVSDNVDEFSRVEGLRLENWLRPS